MIYSISFQYNKLQKRPELIKKELVKSIRGIKINSASMGTENYKKEKTNQCKCTRCQVKGVYT